MNFANLTEVKPEVTFASKSKKINKRFIIGIDPYDNTRSHYDIMVYVVKEGRVVETRKAIPHEKIIMTLKNIFKSFNRRSCKIIRNFKI